MNPQLKLRFGNNEALIGNERLMVTEGRKAKTGKRMLVRPLYPLWLVSESMEDSLSCAENPFVIVLFCFVFPS